MIFILKSQVFSNQYEAFVVFVFVYEAFEAKACPSEPSWECINLTFSQNWSRDWRSYRIAKSVAMIDPFSTDEFPPHLFVHNIGDGKFYYLAV